MTFTNYLSDQVIRRDEQDRNVTSANGDPYEVCLRFGGKEVGYVGNTERKRAATRFPSASAEKRHSRNASAIIPAKLSHS